MVKRKLVLVAACALVASVLGPSARVDAAPTPGPTPTCTKQLNTTRTHELTFPYNTPGAPSFMTMTGSTVVCWEGSSQHPVLVSFNATCIPRNTTRTAKPARVESYVIGVNNDPHAIRVKLTCRARIPNFRGRMSVYKVHQYQTLSLGAWLKKPYVVDVTHQHIQTRI